MQQENNQSNKMQSGEKPLTHHIHAGPVLALLVILLLLIFAGLYLWGSLLQKEVPQPEVLPPNYEPETPRSQADVQILETVSSSDDLGTIEADLTSTNFDSIDTDMEIVGNELEAAIERVQ